MKQIALKALAVLLLGCFWLFVLVPTYPLFGLVSVWVARRINGDGEPRYGEFTKAWFTFRVIP